jgi:enoyl-[acyl-carrier-protein] reductase (NADH)
MTELMHGKSGLITGVANDDSIPCDIGRHTRASSVPTEMIE